MFLLDEILKKLQERGEVRGPGKNGEYITFCVFHPDQQYPNLYIHPQKGFYCFACKAKGSIRKLAKELGIKANSKGISLAELAEVKQLDVKLLQNLGWQEVKWSGKTVIEIPYLNENGEVQAVRYRFSVDGDFKFRWRKGDKTMPYGLQRLSKVKGEEYIVIVEGETDAITLWQHGFPTLGIPGASTWRREWADYIKQIGKVYVWREGDEAGENFTQKVAESLSGNCYVLQSDEAKDPNELHCLYREGFAQKFKELMEKAEKYEKSGQDNPQVQALLSQPNILRAFIEDVANSGVVGEERLIGILGLVLTSATTNRPINFGLLGPSSSGKNFTLSKVLEHFPQSKYVLRSGGSERSFLFSKEDLLHKFLVFEELRGYASGEVGRSLLRSLIWGNKVNYEITLEDRRGEYTTQLVNRPGPTGLLFTSTSLAGLDKETQARLFTHNTAPAESKKEETKKQTRGVLKNIANRLNGSRPSTSFSVETWQTALEILTQPTEVEIPWGPWLAERIDASDISIRRKFELFLYFAYSSALLHRYHRSTNNSGRIVANLADYANAHSLLGKAFEAAQQGGLSDFRRSIVEAVIHLYQKNKPVKATEVAKYLNVSRPAISQNLRLLLEEEYLVNAETRKFHPMKLEPGEPLPEKQFSLPAPQELADELPQYAVSEWIEPISGKIVTFKLDKDGGEGVMNFQSGGLPLNKRSYLNESEIVNKPLNNEANSYLTNQADKEQEECQLSVNQPVNHFVNQLISFDSRLLLTCKPQNQKHIYPPPSADELKKFHQAIRDQNGEIKLILMNYLGEEVFFAEDEEWAKLAPSGYVIYTRDELGELKSVSEAQKMIAHEAKKKGGKIIKRTWMKRG